MRGNEIAVAMLAVVLYLAEFPIPMRGNEFQFSASVTCSGYKFPIPMRGNETWWRRRCICGPTTVSDPHEG